MYITSWLNSVCRRLAPRPNVRHRQRRVQAPGAAVCRVERLESRVLLSAVLNGAGSINVTENDPATAIDTAVTVADGTSTTLASANITITNYVAGQDVLAFTNNGSTMGNIAVSSNTNGVLTLTSAGGTATLAQWEAALQAVTYVNTSDNPMTATRNVTMTVNDGTSDSNTLTSTINLTAVNDGATLSGVANITIAANAPATAINTGLSLTDVDSTTEEYAKVTLTNYVAGEDLLSFTNNGTTMGNISVASNTGGVLTLVSVGGTATLAQWQAALQSVTYVNTSATPTLTVRNVTYEVDSGTSVSNQLASSITLSGILTGVPVLSGGGNINITENDAAAAITAGLTVTDSASTTLASAQVSLTNYVAGQDTLAFTNDGSTMGNIAVASNTGGVLTLTSAGGTATLAQWQAALQAVTYVNTSDNPVTATRHVTVTVNDGTSTSNTLASTISLTAVNDAATLAGVANITIAANAPATAINTGLTLTDIDSNTEEYAKVTLTNYVAGEDVLAFTNNGTTMGNISVASNTGGVLTLVSVGGTATLAQWQAALQSVTYVNTSATPTLTVRNVTYEVDSGTSVSNLLASSITLSGTLTGVPVLAGSGSISFTENGAAVAINTGLTVTDTASTTLASAQVSLTNYVAGQDTLAFTNNGTTMGNIAVASNTGGVLTLTSAGGTATLAQWQAALRAVTYVNTSDNPVTAARNVTVTVNDGTSGSNTLASTISLTAVNDGATLAGVANITVAVNAPATAINTSLTLTDVDSSTEEYAKVTLTNYVAGEDLLGFTNNGTTMGNISVASNTGGVLTLVSVGGTATLAQWEAALHAVTYANTSANPTLTVRNVTFEVDSGTSVSNQLASSITISGTVTGVPVLAGGGSISFTENGAAAAIATGLTVTDTASTTLASAQVSLTNYVAGQDSLAFTNNGTTMGNIAVASNVGGVLTLTSAGGTATLAQWQAALQAVTYVNTSDNPVTATRNVTVTVNDGVSASNTLASTISLTAVNDAAVLAGVANITIAANAPATAINAGLTLTDVDSSTEEYAKVKLTNFVAGEDVLGFTNDGATMGNISVASNTGGVLTLVSVGGTATLAQWEAALRAVTYVNISATPTLSVRNLTYEVDSGTSVSNQLASSITLQALGATDAVFANSDSWS
jgi:hypothetical protein